MRVQQDPIARWQPSEVTSPHLAQSVSVIAAKSVPYVRDGNRLQDLSLYLPRTSETSPQSALPVTSLPNLGAPSGIPRYLTSSVEYGIHCLLWLVESEAPLSSRDLAELQGVSPAFLAKIFPKLQKAGIVAASEGVRAGYRLARRAKNITFLEIVDAIEGEKPLDKRASLGPHRVVGRAAKLIPRRSAAHPSRRAFVGILPDVPRKPSS